MADNNTDDETKYKNTVWLKQSTIDAVRVMYKKDDCRTKSEFIERAIMFYIGFISSNYNPTYLPTIICSLAVELAMTMNIVASDRNLSESFLRELRKNCREEVKELHGDFTFNDANDWQNNR